MFGHLHTAASPFDTLFSELTKPDSSDQKHYPVFLGHLRKKGRYNNIFTRHDHNFPEYNANVIVHSDNQKHILLEGPASHIQEHCERFLDVLVNDWMPITDVIAAGDPFEGRKFNKGYLHYFAEKAHEHVHDHPMLEKIATKFHLVTHKHEETDNITSYIMRINDGEKSRQMRIHHIPNFGDFKTLAFTLAEINALLKIFQEAETLAIHCSAGMGRTGVIELAFCLFNEYEKYFPHNKPDFHLIKLKVNELRILRPELLQTADQYRMAIVLAVQLNAANRNELTDEVRNNAGIIVDNAACEWKNKHAKLAVPVAKYSAKSRNVSDDESHVNEVSANSSDYSDYSEDDDNSVERAIRFN